MVHRYVLVFSFVAREFLAIASQLLGRTSFALEQIIRFWPLKTISIQLIKTFFVSGVMG